MPHPGNDIAKDNVNLLESRAPFSTSIDLSSKLATSQFTPIPPIATMSTKSSPQKFPLGRVMVIGGTGFLGHHVVNLLLRSWATTSVSVVDLTCTRNRRPSSDGVSYHEADMSDGSRLLSIFEEVKPDVVIHTASPPAQGSDATAKALFEKVNVQGTKCVVEACQKTGVKALVYTSSASIISDNKSDLVNADERWPVIRGSSQTEYYSETKAAAEELVLEANRATEAPGLLTSSIRPAGIIGEGDRQAIHHLINIHKQNRTHFQIGENTNLFDFTYVENVAHAHLLAARALLATASLSAQGGAIPLDTERVDGEAFLVTNDTPVYFWDFARTVWNYAGSPHGTEHVYQMSRSLGLVLGGLSEAFFWVLGKPPTFNRQRIVFSCMTRYYNITKAKKRLGYKPIVDLETGVKRAVKWTMEVEKSE